MNPLRSLILAAAGSDAVRRAVTTSPATKGIVERFVAGESLTDAVGAVAALADDGLCATLDYLGEHTEDERQAEQAVQTYVALLDRLGLEGLGARVEVSVKLSAVGMAFDEKLALDNMSRICAAAEQCGTTVTVDMEEHDTVDATLRAITELRYRWPWVGAVLQSYLRRTEDDAKALAAAHSRVRLCKGAYAATDSLAHLSGHEVDLSYVRAANLLLAGDGYPMFATHDPRLIRLLRERVHWYGRKQDSYEYQMLYGVRPEEQRKLAAEGETVRVYVPFGENSYGYLMRRLAERPANLAFFLRSLASRS